MRLLLLGGTIDTFFTEARINNNNHPNDPHVDLTLHNKYFHSLDAKQTPLYYCDGATGTNLMYRLPQQLICEYLKLDIPNKVVPITLWFDTPGLQTTSAYVCKAVKTMAYKDHFFFGGYAEHTSSEPIYLNEQACRELVKNKMAPDGTPLTQTSPNVWTTQKVITIDFVWPKRQEQTVSNYALTLVTISRSNSDDTVVSSVPLARQCQFAEGICPGQDKSLLIWNPKDFAATCRLTKGPSTLCMYSPGDERLTCPQLTLAISKISQISMCSLRMFTSAQGLIYTSDVPNDIQPGAATTSQVERATRVTIRYRRDIPAFEGQETLEMEEHHHHSSTTTTTKPNFERRKRHSTIPPFTEDELVDDSAYQQATPKTIATTKKFDMSTSTTSTEHTTRYIPPFVEDWDIKSNERRPLPESEEDLQNHSTELRAERPVFPDKFEVVEPIPIHTPPNNQPGLTKLPIRQEPRPSFDDFLAFHEATNPQQSMHSVLEQEQKIPNLHTRTGYTEPTTKKTTTTSPAEHEELKYSGTEDDVFSFLNPNSTRFESRIFTSSEIAGRLQYLYQILSLNITHSIQEVHHQTCINQKMMLDLLVTMAEERAAGFITRVLLPESRFLVRNEGDVLLLKPCVPIHAYQFAARNTVNCTRNVPVTYLLNHEQKKGYMTEMAHRIVDEPEDIECEDQTPFYFDSLDDGVIQLTNTTHTFNIPYLPTPQQFNRTFQVLTEQTFTNDATFTASQLHGQDSLLSFMQQMRQPAALDNILRARLQGKQLTPQQTLIAETLRSLTIDPLQNLLHQVGMLILAVVLILVIIRLLWKYRTALFLCCGKCLCFCCKMATPTRRARRSYFEMQNLGNRPPPPYNAIRDIPAVLAMEEIEEQEPLYPALEEKLPTAPPPSPRQGASANRPGPSRCINCENRQQDPLPYGQAILQNDIPKIN